MKWDGRISSYPHRSNVFLRESAVHAILSLERLLALASRKILGIETDRVRRGSQSCSPDSLPQSVSQTGSSQFATDGSPQ